MKTLTLVSGLPRSGTSLMMQLLEAGGMPPWTDGVRRADEDNPQGYHEWEAIQRIASEPAVLDQDGIEHHAIKCISALLPRLPLAHRYRVIFMMRPPLEVAMSQQRMLERRGTQGMGGTISQVAETLGRHRDQVLAHLAAHPQSFEVIEIDYPSLIADPDAGIASIVGFLGMGFLPTSSAMSQVIRPDLYRQRVPRAL